MLGEYCPLSLMHANPLTLAVCGSRFKNRGGAARRGGAGGGCSEQRLVRF